MKFKVGDKVRRVKRKHRQDNAWYSHCSRTRQYTNQVFTVIGLDMDEDIRLERIDEHSKYGWDVDGFELAEYKNQQEIDKAVEQLINS